MRCVQVVSATFLKNKKVVSATTLQELWVAPLYTF